MCDLDEYYNYKYERFSNAHIHDCAYNNNNNNNYNRKSIFHNLRVYMRRLKHLEREIDDMDSDFTAISVEHLDPHMRMVAIELYRDAATKIKGAVAQIKHRYHAQQQQEQQQEQQQQQQLYKEAIDVEAALDEIEAKTIKLTVRLDQKVKNLRFGGEFQSYSGCCSAGWQENKRVRGDSNSNDDAVSDNGYYSGGWPTQTISRRHRDTRQLSQVHQFFVNIDAEDVYFNHLDGPKSEIPNGSTAHARDNLEHFYKLVLGRLEQVDRDDEMRPNKGEERGGGRGERNGKEKGKEEKEVGEMKAKQKGTTMWQRKNQVYAAFYDCGPVARCGGGDEAETGIVKSAFVSLSACPSTETEPEPTGTPTPAITPTSKSESVASPTRDPVPVTSSVPAAAPGAVPAAFSGTITSSNTTQLLSGTTLASGNNNNNNSNGSGSNGSTGSNDSSGSSNTNSGTTNNNNSSSSSSSSGGGGGGSSDGPHEDGGKEVHWKRQKMKQVLKRMVRNYQDENGGGGRGGKGKQVCVVSTVQVPVIEGMVDEQKEREKEKEKRVEVTTPESTKIYYMYGKDNKNKNKNSGSSGSSTAGTHAQKQMEVTGITNTPIVVSRRMMMMRRREGGAEKSRKARRSRKARKIR